MAKKKLKNSNINLIIILVAVVAILFLTFSSTGQFRGHFGSVQNPGPIIEVPVSGPTFTADSDGDGVSNNQDNCPSEYNPSQGDFNNDGTGDKCQDSDGDGLSDYIELNAKFYELTFIVDTSIQISGTDPNSIDSDGDGIWDSYDTYPLTQTRSNRVNSVAEQNYP